jgi:hypothetical protein
MLVDEVGDGSQWPAFVTRLMHSFDDAAPVGDGERLT